MTSKYIKEHIKDIKDEKHIVLLIICMLEQVKELYQSLDSCVIRNANENEYKLDEVINDLSIFIKEGNLLELLLDIKEYLNE